MTETSQYRHLVREFCFGNGVDVGSGGIDPVVPWAIQVELPSEEFTKYNQRPLPETVEWKGSGLDLPFKDGTLDFCYSSHLLEDFADWNPALREWWRVLKIGGYLVILIPDKTRWAEALRRGQPPNCSHAKEANTGELTDHISRIGRAEIIRGS